MDATTIVFIIAALVLGALLGWLLGSRGAAAGQGVADSLRLQLDAVRDERDRHARAIETLRGDHALAIDRLRTEHHDLASRHAAPVPRPNNSAHPEEGLRSPAWGVSKPVQSNAAGGVEGARLEGRQALPGSWTSGLRRATIIKRASAYDINCGH